MTDLDDTERITEVMVTVMRQAAVRDLDMISVMWGAATAVLLLRGEDVGAE